MQVNPSESSSRAQQTASDPALSVWVSANAGTGKTKVLTDRVLRLLLKGTIPSRILCITYTKAAAAEMQNRIYATLGGWVELPEQVLVEKLAALTGERPGERQVARARTLFARVLDAPDGLRIMTIHSFCQSLLRRFPLEARLAPHFDVIDERTANELLADARHRLLMQAVRQPETPLARAVARLTAQMAESRFQQLLSVLLKQRALLEDHADEHSGEIRMISRVMQALNVKQDETETVIIEQFIDSFSSYDSALRMAINPLQEGKPSDIKKAAVLARWCEADRVARAALWEELPRLWLKADGTPAKFATKDVAACEAVNRIATDLLPLMLSLHERLAVRRLFDLTESCLLVVYELINLYSDLKRNHGVMDYDDLVHYAVRLLREEGVAAWVLFKLDGGLDHLLIDEAQDTGPMQWELVERLTAEFYGGMGRHEGVPVPRTLFVVGDEKQSIYGFQGAAPDAFGEQRRVYAARSAQAQLDFRAVPLGLSYRSTEAVLTAVDAVFNQLFMREGITSEKDREIEHGAFRRGQAGRVEVWPVLVPEEKKQSDPFDIRKSNDFQPDVKYIMAERIAKKIRSWLDSGERLASQNRAVKAGDILILVRKRGEFAPIMIRALKRHGIPVAGADRLELTEHIAVMDMLALMEFLLLPEDDLNLACLLKSPICGATEEELFALAYDRGGQSLWQQLEHSAHPAKLLLQRLLAQADFLRPYELLAQVLEQEGGRRRFAVRLGEEALDPLEELLALALQYEQEHAPSLQGFLQWMRSGKVQVKRDMEQGQDVVRIMTVHGSKGLQAPVVFLPDSASNIAEAGGSHVPEPFWYDYDGRKVMVWSPRQEMDTPRIALLRAERKAAELAESKRLLYVAMTRAADRLYIGGWLNHKVKGKVPEQSWYAWMDAALKPLGTSLGDDGYFLENPQTAEAATAKTTHTAPEPAPMPDYFLRPPVPEPYPPQPLVPSRGDDMAASSPVETARRVLSPALPVENAGFERGNLIHRLLQYLPELPVQQRGAALRLYLSRYAREWTEAAREAVAAEVLAVLEHPELAPAFRAGSLAEVSLSGLVQGEEGAEYLLSARIDRLYVAPDGIWIIDYKTGQKPPARVQDIPPAHLRQMALYKHALQRIYPNRPVHAVLLWTAEARWMLLPPEFDGFLS